MHRSSRRSLDKHERPIAGVSHIAEQTVDQKPQGYPRRNVAAQKVVPRRGNDGIHMLFAGSAVNCKMMVEASYGHDRGGLAGRRPVSQA